MRLRNCAAREVINLKVWFEEDYEQLASAFHKGMPVEKVLKVLERRRELDSRGAEVAFWNALSDEEANKIRSVEPE